jgi:hypothetical protein
MNADRAAGVCFSGDLAPRYADAIERLDELEDSLGWSVEAPEALARLADEACA